MRMQAVEEITEFLRNGWILLVQIQNKLHRRFLKFFSSTVVEQAQEFEFLSLLIKDKAAYFNDIVQFLVEVEDNPIAV